MERYCFLTKLSAGMKLQFMIPTVYLTTQFTSEVELPPHIYYKLQTASISTFGKSYSDENHFHLVSKS